MSNEKALVIVHGNVPIVEMELIREAVNFAKSGFDGGPISLPKNYDLSKAVKNFCFALPKVKDIEQATKESIFQATHEYVSEGLDIGKKQCALIVRAKWEKGSDGKKVDTGVREVYLQKQYFGNKKIAMDCNPDILTISDGTCIYQGDEIEEVHLPNGNLVIKHKSQFMNRFNDMVGAYAVVTFRDGSSHAEIMTIGQIRAAWAKSEGGGEKETHKKFPEEMACKTVINRLCKKLTNSTDDEGTLSDNSEPVEYEHVDFETSPYADPDDAPEDTAPSDSLSESTDPPVTLSTPVTAPPVTPQPAPAIKVICSECGAEMVKRAKKGTTYEFYGCTSYPACKHTMSVKLAEETAKQATYDGDDVPGPDDGSGNFPF